MASSLLWIHRPTPRRRAPTNPFACCQQIEAGIDKHNDIAYNITVSPAKLLQSARNNPSGLRFSGLCKLAEAFGFVFQRQKGSHKVYAHEGIRQIMNFQNAHGMAKAYHVTQLLGCIDQHRLTLGK